MRLFSLVLLENFWEVKSPPSSMLLLDTSSLGSGEEQGGEREGSQVPTSVLVPWEVTWGWMHNRGGLPAPAAYVDPAPVTPGAPNCWLTFL